MSLPHFLISAWGWSWTGCGGTAAMLLAYMACFGWSRRAAWLVAGVVIFLVTLVSPLAALANGYLFSAHMVQHILLLLAVPALALRSLPATVHLTARAARLLHPAFCWACGAGAMWIWHAPALCNAAATSPAISAVQTLSLLVLGAAFWWPLLAPTGTQRISALGGVAYLFASCAACTVLGIILTFSPIAMCPAFLHPADRLGLGPLIRETWGMTAMRDQQIGGLIMWVPMCLVYLGAIFGQMARWYAEPANPRTALS